MGQRPARRECCSGHEADAGSRNPLLLLSPRVWRIGMSTKTAATAGKTGGTCNSHTAIRNLETHERAGGFEQQRSRPPPAAETGRRGWGSAPIFQGPAKGLQKNRQAQLVRPCALRPAGQKSPCGAFLDARLAQSTRAHQKSSGVLITSELFVLLACETHERAGGFEQQRSRPPPAAETGRRGWGSAPIFQGPAKGLQKNRQAQLVRPCALRPAGKKSPCGAFLDARLA